MIKDNELCSLKSNELIQNYAWHLNEKELKIFEYLCCCVDTKSYNEENNTITTSFKEFISVCNSYTTIGGSERKAFKNSLKNLSDKSILIDNKNNGGIIRIISEVIWNNKSNICVLYMSNSFREFVKNLSNGYTFTELKIINRMSSKYTINLYYLVQSWSGKKTVTLDIDYLRNKLQVPKSSYDNIGKFKQILDRSIKEYNEVIDYYDKLGCKISYKILKEGKKYSSIIIETHSLVNIKDDSGFGFNYSLKPNELNFESDEIKESYISGWVEYKYFCNEPDVDKYLMLYTTIPEKVHNYEEYRVNAIYDIALEYRKYLIKNRYVEDAILDIETLINRFNTRKWYKNYERKCEVDIYSYYLKCFESWCQQEKEYKANT